MQTPNSSSLQRSTNGADEAGTYKLLFPKIFSFPAHVTCALDCVAKEAQKSNDNFKL